MKHEAHVSQSKRDVVTKICDLINEYPIVGAINMLDLPAPPLQSMRAQLRNNAVLFMTKRRIIKIALEQSKSAKRDIDALIPHLGGMPALLFTKESPFKLSRTLQKNKSPAPAKAGQIAPRDIMVNKGATSFAPGPIIGELAAVGIKSGVEAGKIAIKEDSLVVKKGEKIKPKVAEILARLGITPMEVGLDLVAVYENGVIYAKDILGIDDKEYLGRLNTASRWAFNLAMYSSYPTKATIPLLIGKAFKEAKSLGISAKVFEPDILTELVESAERQMLSIKDDSPKGEVVGGIEVPTREQLEANIRMRDRQKEMKDVEKITEDIKKKFAK